MTQHAFSNFEPAHASGHAGHDTRDTVMRPTARNGGPWRADVRGC